MIGLLLALSTPAEADPCGMVPPILVNTPGFTPEIQREGAQRTYVMHRKVPGVGGIETMALRPGFVGNVEDFGMLIPFPTAPAIRKIDDETFAHVEGAIDPPEVTVQVYDPMPMASVSRSSGAGLFGRAKSSEMDSMGAEQALGYMEVNVVREEAVGMYEVAVLEAGSPKALERWMADNDYSYPEGMDEVVADYVDIRWCFVAIKARVGGAEGATPVPGMRTADTSRPAGSQFDGHVQGMAFRFWSDEPVVPMRLSVFNGEDPRNVVYVLADDPVKVAKTPETLVVRQVGGEELYGHLTDELTVNWINGDWKDLSEPTQQLVRDSLDPATANGIARDLFAADLLAARTGQLILPFEEEEKELLNISESFGLRGVEIDAMMGEEAITQRARAVSGALDDVKEMHLSVIDGVLPQKLLATENLAFATHEMDSKRNTPRDEPIKPVGAYHSFWRGQ
ncbi:MAG: DUF2330 domain-containing protein [Proteobacteria bacterium]|nr:DUF2330 domain-containing protein [Pseudomonadota bacterium]